VRELFGPTGSTLTSQMTGNGSPTYFVQGIVKVLKYGISSRKVDQ